MNVKVVGVVGAGQMGSGIAQVASQSGYDVIVQDLQQSLLDTSRTSIEKNLDRMVEKQKLSKSDRDAAVGRLHFATELAGFESADLVIEAATENVDTKLSIFKTLDLMVPAHGLLCSNTSSISITQIAAATKRPEKVIGLHFMNPVPIMKLVEVIRGLRTSDDTYKTAIDVAHKMGKETVTATDVPGFLVNRILCPMINEAIVALESGIATAEDVDKAMKLGTNQPMGPLELADFVGLDTVLAIMEVLHRGIGEDKYRPAPLLRKYVAAGWYGRKSGRGFYNYEKK
jgi:3-hydroxybutyryl-CoA dehydrogenase